MTRKEKIDLLQSIKEGRVSIEAIQPQIFEAWVDIEDRPGHIVEQLTGRVMSKIEMRECLALWKSSDQVKARNRTIAILWCDLDSDE